MAFGLEDDVITFGEDDEVVEDYLSMPVQREEARRIVQQRQALEAARKVLKESSAPNTEATLYPAGMSAASLPFRLVEMEQQALTSAIARALGYKSEDINRMLQDPQVREALNLTISDELQLGAGAFRQAAAERDVRRYEAGETVVPPIIARGARGAVETLPTMAAGAAVGGPPGAIGAAMLTTGDRAIYEAREAGLEGQDVYTHAATQAGLEGAIAGAFQMIGLGGAESVVSQALAREGARQGIKQLGGNFLKQFTAEETEELLTTYTQNLASAWSGADPRAATPEAQFQAAQDTFVQTAITMGLVQSPQAAREVYGAVRRPRAAIPPTQPSAGTPDVEQPQPTSAAPDIEQPEIDLGEPQPTVAPQPKPMPVPLEEAARTPPSQMTPEQEAAYLAELERRLLQQEEEVIPRVPLEEVLAGLGEDLVQRPRALPETRESLVRPQVQVESPLGQVTPRARRRLGRYGEGFAEPPTPAPTQAPPGSDEKLAEMYRRARRGEAIFSPEDATEGEDLNPEEVFARFKGKKKLGRKAETATVSYEEVEERPRPGATLSEAMTLARLQDRPRVTPFTTAETGKPFEAEVYRYGTEGRGRRFYSEMPDETYAKAGRELTRHTVRLQNPYVAEGFVPQLDLLEEWSEAGDAKAKEILAQRHTEQFFELADSYIEQNLSQRGHDGVILRGDPLQGGNEVFVFGERQGPQAKTATVSYETPEAPVAPAPKKKLERKKKPPTSEIPKLETEESPDEPGLSFAEEPQAPPELPEMKTYAGAKVEEKPQGDYDPGLLKTIGEMTQKEAQRLGVKNAPVAIADILDTTGMSLADLHAALRKLRLADLVSVQTWQSKTGLEQRIRDAAIVEGAQGVPDHLRPRYHAVILKDAGKQALEGGPGREEAKESQKPEIPKYEMAAPEEGSRAKLSPAETLQEIADLATSQGVASEYLFGRMDSQTEFEDKLRSLSYLDTGVFDPILNEANFKKAGRNFHNEYLRTIVNQYDSAQNRLKRQRNPEHAKRLWDQWKPEFEKRLTGAVEALDALGLSKEATFYREQVPRVLQAAEAELFGSPDHLRPVILKDAGKQALEGSYDTVTVEKEEKPEIPKYERTTPKDEKRREELRGLIREREERAKVIRENKEQQEAELKKTRRNAFKKRGKLQGEVNEKDQRLAELRKEVNRFQDELRETELEDALENPRSQEHFLAGMVELMGLRVEAANRFGEEERRAGSRALAQQAYEQAKGYDEQMGRFQHDLMVAARDYAREAGLKTESDIETAAELAVRDFSVTSRSSLKEQVERDAKRVREARLRPIGEWSVGHLSEEQKAGYEARMKEAVQDDASWQEKLKAIREEAEKQSAEIGEEQRKKQDEASRAAAEKAAEEERTRLAEARKSAKESQVEEKYWKESRERAQGLKGKRSQVEITEKGGAKRTEDAEVFGEFAIHKGKDDKGKEIRVLTHLPTSKSVVATGTVIDAKHFMQVAKELGYDLNEHINQKGDMSSEAAAAFRRIMKAWDYRELGHLEDGERNKLLASVPIKPTTVQADVVLDSYDLGVYGGAELTDRGYKIVRRMAAREELEVRKNENGKPYEVWVKTKQIQVPEFAWNPVFTVNADKKLVFQDGYTYTLEPEHFNLHPSEITEGQTVGINLEDLGIDRLTAGEAVVEMFKNTGFAKVKQRKGEVTAVWKGKKIRAVGGEDSWQVVQDNQGIAAQTLKKMGFLAETAAVPEEKPPKQPSKRTQQAKEERDAAWGDLKKDLKDRGIGANLFADPVLVSSAVKVAYTAVKYETYRFADMVEEAREQLGVEVTERIMPLLRNAWNTIRTDFPGLAEKMDEATEDSLAETDTVTVEPPTEEPPAESPPPAPEGEPRITSIKNAVVNQLRAARGMPELEGVPHETWEEWLDQAAARMATDPRWTQRLVEELHQTARPTDKIETAALQLHYADLNREYEAVTERLFAAQDGGDAATIAQAQTDADLVYNELAYVEAATKKTGAEASRAFGARQITLGEDFSLGGMVRRRRTAAGGRRLTEEEMERDRARDQRIRDLEKQLAEIQQRNDDQERNRLVDEGIQRDRERVQRRRRRSPRATQARERVNQAWEKFSQVTGAKIKSLLGEETGAVGEVDPDALAAAKELAAAYLDLGVVTFTEFAAHARNVLGDKLDSWRPTLQAAWEEQTADNVPMTPEFEPDDLAGLSRLAKQIQRSVVEAGITERESVVDVVHEALQEFFPELSRRQAMDAMSGYGIFRPLSQDEIDREVRRINAELLQLAKLDDMAQGIAPKATGFERPKPEDEERRLKALVYEMKKRGGFVVTDPERSLQTALGAAKRATQNVIADLEHEIRTRERIVRERTPLQPDAELESLRKRRDELRELHKKIFPPRKATMAQKVAAAERALTKAIAQLEADLAAGNIGPKKKPAPLSSPKLDALRARLEALRAQRQALRDAINPKMTPEQRALRAYEAQLKKRLAEYQRRRAEKDFAPKPKKKLKLNDEQLKLKKAVQDEKSAFLEELEEYRRSQLHPVRRRIEDVREALHASRAIQTALDFSAVLRQGGVLAFSHPVLAAKAMPDMFRAFWRPGSEFRAAEEIRNRPNAPLYEQAGLSLTTREGAITRQEEAYMGRWLRILERESPTDSKKKRLFRKALAFVPASERAYVTFLNRIRADVFDSLVETLGKNGQVNLEQAQVIANFVNVATGRADLGKWNAAAGSLASVFFAPRYVVSRFQLLAGQPLWTQDRAARRLIAKEYARCLAGVGTVYGVALLVGALMDDDDEDRPTLELNPVSSDFGKVKIGDTRIDLLSGLAQATTFLSRVTSGRTKNSQGEIVALRGEEKPALGRSVWDVMGSFGRTKLAPALGSAVDWLVGENVVGEKVTTPGVALDLVTPLSLREVHDVIRDQGFTKGTALFLTSLFGVGLSVYGEETTYAKLGPAEREKAFESYLRLMEFDDQPGFSEMLTPEQLQKLEERRKTIAVNQVKKVALSEDYPTKAHEGETYEETVKQWEAERDAAQAFLEAHKDSPLVKQAINQVRSSKAYYDLREGKMDLRQGPRESGEEFHQRRERYWRKVSAARDWRPYYGE